MFLEKMIVAVHESGNVRIVFVEPKLEVGFTAKPFGKEIGGGLVDSSGVLRELPINLDAVEGEGFIGP